MAKYESEFTKLSRYAPELLGTRRKRCMYFQKGLNDEYKSKVVGHQYDDFSSLLGHALDLERIKKVKGLDLIEEIKEKVLSS